MASAAPSRSAVLTRTNSPLDCSARAELALWAPLKPFAVIGAPVKSPSATSTSHTSGAPFVMVPVLSRTTVFTPCAVCSASADFTRMPFAAPRPVPTMMAVGVASPKAQGHEITSTLIA